MIIGINSTTDRSWCLDRLTSALTLNQVDYIVRISDLPRSIDRETRICRDRAILIRELISRAKDDYVLLEDDAILSDDFLRVLAALFCAVRKCHGRYWIVNLAKPTFPVFSTPRKISPYHHAYIPAFLAPAAGLVLSYLAAEIICPYLEAIERTPVDILVGNICRDHHIPILQCDPPIVKTDNTPSSL